MKSKTKQEINALLEGIRHDLISAALIANDGAPSPKDTAELMAAWGLIVKTIKHSRADASKTFVDAQLDILAGLMGAAA